MTATRDISRIIESDNYWKDILYEILAEMDPWDIDIAELATRYAKKVEEMREMNFRIPANVLIVSAVLLRMKADKLIIQNESLSYDNEAVLDFGSLDVFFSEEFSEEGKVASKKLDDWEKLALVIKPRRVVKRRVTISDLISALQEVLEDKKIKEYKKRIKKKLKEKKVIEIVMGKDMKAIIEETYEKIIKIISMKSNKVVRFSELVESKEDLIPKFLSLLHLHNNQKIKLKQEKLFDEIFITTP